MKTRALAKYLEVKVNDIEENEHSFEVDGMEWLVLTDEEADEAAQEYIEQSLWAFNPSFMADFTGLPIEIFEIMQEKCEDANEPYLKLIENIHGIDCFVGEAIIVDGRGHFLSSYDGEEIEQDEFYLYRVN